MAADLASWQCLT